MRTTLSVLDRTGDTKVTWDHDNPEECDKARAKVAELKAQGYTFFLVDGTPADEVSAGEGYLSARILESREVVAETASEEFAEVTPVPEGTPVLVRRGRGRPAKQADKSIIAVRPMRGG
jgi:hypothetical protein